MPAGAGTTAGLLLLKVTAMSEGAAASSRVTVPTVLLPPRTVFLTKLTDFTPMGLTLSTVFTELAEVAVICAL